MNFGIAVRWGCEMRTCEACGRDFVAHQRSMTCPYCGYDTDPRSHTPRIPESLAQLEEERREEEEWEAGLREYLDLEKE